MQTIMVSRSIIAFSNTLIGLQTNTINPHSTQVTRKMAQQKPNQVDKVQKCQARTLVLFQLDQATSTSKLSHLQSNQNHLKTLRSLLNKSLSQVLLVWSLFGGSLRLAVDMSGSSGALACWRPLVLCFGWLPV